MEKLQRLTLPQPDVSARKARRLPIDCKWAFLSTEEESLSFLLTANWHLWAWLIDICVGQSLVCSFTYVFVTAINKSGHTKLNFMELHSDVSAVILPILPFAQICNSRSGVFSPRHCTTRLGHGRRVAFMELDKSEAAVFRSVTCCLEELQGRLLVGTPLHLYKTLSGEWIQTQTT